jgi:glycosyltransferase involved in cell wall biosynthesis
VHFFQTTAAICAQAQLRSTQASFGIDRLMKGAGRRKGPLSRGTIAVSANESWNLLNFRSGLLKDLQERGYSVVALVPDGDKASDLRSLGIEVRPVPIEARGTSPGTDLRSFWRYFVELSKLRPVAFLGFTAKPNIYGSIAAHLLGIPVINNVTGLGSVFAREGALKRLMLLLYRVAFARSKTVFFQNRDDLDLFLEKGLVSPTRAAVIPGSGIDLTHFRPAPKSRTAEPFTFLFAARLLWDKGVGDYVEAAKRVWARNPAVRFLILGILQPEGPTAVSRQQLEQWQADGIQYLGSADDVRPILREADCVVLPSRYREGVPHVLLEALAMGIPVIASDVPGCRDAVEDGRTGFLCRPGSLESLSAVMERMIDSSHEERSRMGAEGRNEMKRRFRHEIVHEAYANAIENPGAV